MLEFELEIEHEFLFEQVDSIILNEFLKQQTGIFDKKFVIIQYELNEGCKPKKPHKILIILVPQSIFTGKFSAHHTFSLQLVKVVLAHIKGAVKLLELMHEFIFSFNT